MGRFLDISQDDGTKDLACHSTLEHQIRHGDEATKHWPGSNSHVG